MRLKLPARFEDMTLAMLQVLETTDDMLACLEVCTGQPKEQLRQLPKVLLEEGYTHIQNVRAAETQRHLTRFTLHGMEYGFIPNWDEFTAGEWIDAEGHCKDFWRNAHKLMALLFRPVSRSWGEAYEIEAYTARESAEPFLDMPADQVAGALLFFSTTRSERLNTLRSCLTAIAKGTNLGTSGAGTLLFTPSLASRFWRWMTSPVRRLGTSSPTSPS